VAVHFDPKATIIYDLLDQGSTITSTFVLFEAFPGFLNHWLMLQSAVVGG
jgi:hypothetical protein